jgi:hypothetical protein
MVGLSVTGLARVHTHEPLGPLAFVLDLHLQEREYTRRLTLAGFAIAQRINWNHSRAAITFNYRRDLIRVDFKMRKHKLRISIRILLGIVAGAAVLSLWLANTYNSAHNQEAAIKEVAKSEGIVRFDSKVWAPEWLRKAVGEEYFRSAKTVSFATNQGRKSGSNEAKATDENLGQLEFLTDVETLELGNNEEVTDRGLVHLEPLKNLSILYLHQTGVRGPGLVHISRLPRLHTITLSHSELGDDGLKHLGNMSHLRWAALDQTNVTDAGIPDLAKAKALETLSLRNTAVSDAGLRHLEQLQRLESLDVTGTRVTAGGVARLRQALPRCRVEVTFGLGVVASEELLFPEGYRPTATEVNSKLKMLKIDGEVEADPSQPGEPIVSLRLFNCTLSDKVVLALLVNVPQLEVLNLRGGLIGDELLAGIGRNPIRYLSLQGTRVTDAGLPHLSRLTGLKELILSDTDITDEGLIHLHRLSKLNNVVLDNTRTTRTGITRLREALPNW